MKEIETQLNKVKEDLVVLHKMLRNKITYMENIDAPRPDVRRVASNSDVITYDSK